MKFLHTADWHVGKALKGRNRLDEQRAVLAEIIDVALREEVDAILIAGDLYDTAAPSADAQRLVNSALLKLAEAAFGDARMLVDGREIYTAKDLRVGLFTSTEDF